MGNRKPSQNWDHLRYFLAVARTGTLSAAAEQLGTEHTTVARHIQALEDELNSRLFHKSSSGYGLTDAGERLLAGAEAMESAYVFTKAAASSEGQPISGKVRIGAALEQVRREAVPKRVAVDGPIQPSGRSGLRHRALQRALQEVVAADPSGARTT